MDHSTGGNIVGMAPSFVLHFRDAKRSVGGIGGGSNDSLKAEEN